ncbi:MAG: hypothetical protein AAGB46_17475, partial [Verrucomicrobiota bacterium]
SHSFSRYDNGHLNKDGVHMVCGLDSEYALAVDGALGGNKRRNQTPVLPEIEPMTEDSISEDWRALWGMSKVVLTKKRWSKLDMGQRKALRQYVHAGGDVILTGKSDYRGLLGLNFSEELKSRRSVRIGLGTFSFQESSEPKDVAKIVRWAGPYTIDGVESIGIMGEVDRFVSGSFGYFATLILFLILVGPVNLGFFCRGRKRYLIFVTTPLIVIAFVGSSLLYTVFKDGVGGSGKTYRMSVFEPKEKQVVRMQAQTSIVGMKMARGFELPGNAHFSLLKDLGAGGGKYGRGNGEYWGDWFKSRASQAHLIVSIEPSREEIRIERTSVGEGLIAKSRIKGTLTPFVYRDEHQDWWYLESLSLGEKKEMRKMDRKEVDNVFSGISDGKAEKLFAEFAHRSRANPHHFFGGLSQETFEGFDTLGSLEWRNVTHLATGSCVLEEKGGS